ncbi:hypothetical protein PIB30_050079 [Stylosanthes scabra]|uniref:Uncharacterized protein n=1 Tax=Stylosanthes scabra TaxID=79078 RepID=A0ABU6WK91_9FABA|nr:hypothetical protein [Stylosanthes scabra]
MLLRKIPNLSFKPLLSDGLCQYNALPYFFGVGSERRGVETHIPDPYAIEIGNPPEGYDEKWLINVHAIDTRGVQDKVGCTECRCDLYNITKDSDLAKYGNGSEAGNEKGYLVGMTTCYPQPGSIKISNGETLTLEVDYSNTKLHSGVTNGTFLPPRC